MDDKPLKNSLHQLYTLSRLKHTTVDTVLSIWKSIENEDSLWYRPLQNDELAMFLSLKQAILQIQLREDDDQLIWMPGEGIFSTTKCCKLLQGSTSLNPSSNSKWKAVWESKVPPKINIFPLENPKRSAANAQILEQTHQLNSSIMCMV